MSDLEGKKEAPRDDGDKRPDFGEGDKSEDFGKRGEKFRELEKREKEDVPEEYKEASELVASLALTLSEGPLTFEKIDQMDRVDKRMPELCWIKDDSGEWELLFDPYLCIRYVRLG